MATFTLHTVGIIHSPYQEKFAIPRQPGLVRAASARLELVAPFNQPDCVRGIEQFSHLWLSFIFHGTMDEGWHPTVRPPRLGGNERMGVFATRATYRPNPLGLSVVRLLGVTQENGGVWLELGGVDLLDGTPIVDIKPYIPYADSVAEAQAGFAQAAPLAPLNVQFCAEVAAQLSHQPQLAEFIAEVLAQDPRPTYKRGKQDEKIYGVKLAQFNVRFRIDEPLCEVLALEALA
ncbi:MAG: tRNA (N6-threonylcarbamoyladenosine(37)-N6)-methyltransferase TrmO [Aeromonas sp.]